MVESHETSGTHERPTTDSETELSDLRAALRRCELRVEGLRQQLELRLAELQHGASNSDLVQRLTAERDQARADLADLRATRLFRYSAAPRRVYGRARELATARRINRSR